ncbi:response regulator [Polaribacter sp. MSW13]|uniref:Response regulator n=1 Tax=Polaribacter marinus TaxID=2916838 RepID=A0A9X1VRE4_9FLAO|nr:response regulator [Polaribacter marinus]MCI2229375.1 response regulator [Polaribacter marinus]
MNNLLILEDNSFVRNNIFDAIKDTRSVGEIQQTESLKEAISLLDDTNFELIILDIKLPDGYGIELLKVLKERQIKTKVFVFSMSTELKKTCLKYGAEAFFDKAKDFNKLVEAIKKV